MNTLIQDNNVVMCRVISFSEFAYQCEILENYTDEELDAELYFKDLTRKKRLRVKPQSILQINKILPLRISDTDDQVITLSKLQISDEEINECEERYAKYKTLNNILNGIAHTLDKDLQKMYDDFIIPILNEKRTPLDILVESIDRDFDDVIKDDKIKEKLKEDLTEKVIKKKVKLVQKMRINCFTPDGINTIKSALKTGEADDLNIYLDTPPYYVISYETKDIDYGRKYIKQSVEKIKQSIMENGGEIKLEDIHIYE